MYLADWLHFAETKAVTRPDYKIIDSRTHGIIDYCHAAFFLGMSIVVRKNKAAALTALGTGAFVLVQSLLTDYPLGFKRDLTFETHGKMDAAFGSLSWALPRIFGFQHTKAAKSLRDQLLRRDKRRHHDRLRQPACTASGRQKIDAGTL